MLDVVQKENMKQLGIVITLLIVVFGCSQAPVAFQSAEAIIEKQVGHETFEQGRLKWAFCDVIGCDGPYTTNPRDFKGTDFQSNPGQVVTFWVQNKGARHSQKYIPATDRDFFMTIAVANAEGKHALIICKTIDTHNN